MNRLAPLLLILALGCASFQTNAGKTLASTAITVDAAMKGWAKWADQNGRDPARDLSVRTAYVRYQMAMQVASSAYVRLAQSQDRSQWNTASANLLKESAAVLDIIKAFTSI